MLNSRRLASSAAAISASALAAWRSVISMFDWPEHSHTSPTSTSVRRWLMSPALTTSACGPPALCAGSSMRQRPVASAVAVAFAVFSDTVTRVPASARPQIGIGRPRCSTA